MPGIYWIMSPPPLGGGDVFDHHGTVVGAEHEVYERVLVIREPRQRLEGLYRHFCWAQRQHGNPLVPFPAFVRMVHDDDQSLSWIYRYTISRWIGTTEFHAVLKFGPELWDWVQGHYPHAFRFLAPSYPDKFAFVIQWNAEAEHLASAWAASDMERWFS